MRGRSRHDAYAHSVILKAAIIYTSELSLRAQRGVGLTYVDHDIRQSQCNRTRCAPLRLIIGVII
jgi:hypothetical protein